MRRSIPHGCVARRLNSPAIRPPRVLPCGRLDTWKCKFVFERTLSPERAISDSPGQRPGVRNNQKIALKGRYKDAGHNRRSFCTAPSGLDKRWPSLPRVPLRCTLGYRILPFQGAMIWQEALQSPIIFRVPWKIVFSPNLCVVPKILSSEYQLYASGKILGTPWSWTKILIFQDTLQQMMMHS